MARGFYRTATIVTLGGSLDLVNTALLWAEHLQRKIVQTSLALVIKYSILMRNRLLYETFI